MAKRGRQPSLEETLALMGADADDLLEAMVTDEDLAAMAVSDEDLAALIPTAEDLARMAFGPADRGNKPSDAS